MSSTILHSSYSQICGFPGGGVRCGEGGSPLPGSPSSGVTAMDAGRQPTGGPKQRRTVSSVVLDTSNAGIRGPTVVRCESAKGDPARAESISGGDGD